MHVASVHERDIFQNQHFGATASLRTEAPGRVHVFSLGRSGRCRVMPRYPRQIRHPSPEGVGTLTPNEVILGTSEESIVFVQGIFETCILVGMKTRILVAPLVKNPHSMTIRRVDFELVNGKLCDHKVKLQECPPITKARKRVSAWMRKVCTGP